MKTPKDYANFQKSFYDNTAEQMFENHRSHDANPDYEGILLKPIDSKWKDKVALDFGCGRGRNMTNMLRKGVFKRVDGVDISQRNVDFAKINLATEVNPLFEYNFFVNDGDNASVLPSDTYDFVMSTITFQHICVYSTRFRLMTDIYRSLKNGGCFSFQMGHGKSYHLGVTTASYYEDACEATRTNSGYDVRVENTQDILDDLANIGFKTATYTISHPWEDHHPSWIYIQAWK